MSRLIDADKLIEKLKGCARGLNCEFNSACRTIIEVVKEQPTAFDVDKAIEQLDELVTINMEVLGIRADYVNLEHVIKIVKVGGIDD